MKTQCILALCIAFVLLSCSTDEENTSSLQSVQTMEQVSDDDAIKKHITDDYYHIAFDVTYFFSSRTPMLLEKILDNKLVKLDVYVSRYNDPLANIPNLSVDVWHNTCGFYIMIMNDWNQSPSTRFILVSEKKLIGLDGNRSIEIRFNDSNHSISVIQFAPDGRWFFREVNPTAQPEDARITVVFGTDYISEGYGFANTYFSDKIDIREISYFYVSDEDYNKGTKYPTLSDYN